jgi:hypothetical protein
MNAQEREWREALQRIVERFEREDQAKGNKSFDERRSPLAWAMYTDAKNALAERGATPCPDCDEAAKHAYSDATTPGFFSPFCSKHRPSTGTGTTPQAERSGGPLCDNCGKSSKQHYCWADSNPCGVSTYHPSEGRAVAPVETPELDEQQDGITELRASYKALWKNRDEVELRLGGLVKEWRKRADAAEAKLAENGIVTAFGIFNSGFLQHVSTTRLDAEAWARHHLVDSPEVEIKRMTFYPVPPEKRAPRCQVHFRNWCAGCPECEVESAFHGRAVAPVETPWTCTCAGGVACEAG